MLLYKPHHIMVEVIIDDVKMRIVMLQALFVSVSVPMTIGTIIHVIIMVINGLRVKLITTKLSDHMVGNLITLRELNVKPQIGRGWLVEAHPPR